MKLTLKCTDFISILTISAFNDVDFPASRSKLKFWLDLFELQHSEDVHVEEGQVRLSRLQRVRTLHQVVRHQQAHQHEKRHNKVQTK